MSIATQPLLTALPRTLASVREAVRQLQDFILVLVALVVAALAGAPAAQACGFHDPSSVNLGMLNWAYPDALHVRTAVWMAQRDAELARTEPQAAIDPASSTFRLQQMLRLRETQTRLDALRGRIHAALDGQPMPAFSIVLIGPMLWTRFESTDGTVTMVSHATGPAPSDVVIVTDDPVVGALLEGRITSRQARSQGLVRLYGVDDNVRGVSALLDRLDQRPEVQTSRVQKTMEVH